MCRLGPLLPRLSVLMMGAGWLMAGFPWACQALPPVNTWGYVEYVGRHETHEEAGDVIVNLLTLRGDGSTYLYQPWVALVDAGLGLSFSRTDDEGGGRTGTILTGGGRLRLFPSSRFPFTTFLEHNDSRVSGDLAGPDITTTSFGVSQQYLPDGGGRYLLDYRRTLQHEGDDILDNGIGDETDDQLRVSLARAFGPHSFDFTSSLERIEREDRNESIDRDLQLLRHRYRRNGSFSWDNLGSLSDFRFNRLGVDSRTELLQLNSVAFWRPQLTRPLLVTGTVLLQDFTSETIGQSTDTQTAVLNAGATYQWTPYVALRGNLGTTLQRADSGDQTITFQRVGALYTPPSIPLGQFEYDWSVSGDVGNRTGDEDGTVQEVLASLGQGLRRTFPTGEGASVALSVGQQGSITEDTADRSIQLLIHTVSLGWSEYHSTASSYVTLSASDTRRFGDEASSFQLVNLQASRNQLLTRVSSLTGNVTLQATRADAPGVTQDWIYTTGLNVVYQHRRVFGVPLLRFTSELRLLSDRLAFLLEPQTDLSRREDNVWRNRLDYQIGRLELSLRANLSEIDGALSSLVLFQVRRSFGGLQ